MEKYLVGGAVRDILMGVTPKDQDFVVVGSNTEEMLATGLFTQVGESFPVFLENSTGHEYALARTEMKTGTGYGGFEFATEQVTLEMDVRRRDFTINAMAMDLDGNLIDPLGGKSDLDNRILRMANPDSFAEDPVRILRLARFAARLGPTWTIDLETKKSARKCAKSGELKSLQSDRIWKELSRAMMEPYPWLFFDALSACDCLHPVFPIVYRLKTSTESEIWHPEGNSYQHTMMVLKESVACGDDLQGRLCALSHDFGKAVTPVELLPSHHGHDTTGAKLMEENMRPWGVPVQMIEICAWVARHHMKMHSLKTLRPATVLKMIAPKTKGSWNTYLGNLCARDSRGRGGHENDDTSHCDIFIEMADKVNAVNASDYLTPEEIAAKKGPAMGDFMGLQRQKIIREIQKGMPVNPYGEASPFTNETIVNQILRFSAIVRNDRTPIDVQDHLESEVLELRQELDGTGDGKDGVIGEAVDVILCAVDMLHQAGITTESQISAVVASKLEKWKKIYGDNF